MKKDNEIINIIEVDNDDINKEVEKLFSEEVSNDPEEKEKKLAEIQKEEQRLCKLVSPPLNELVRDLKKPVPKIHIKIYISIVVLMLIFYLSYMNLCALLPQQSKRVEVQETTFDFYFYPPPTEFVYNRELISADYKPLQDNALSTKCYRDPTCPGGIVYPQKMKLANEDPNNSTVTAPTGTQVVVFASLDFKSWWVAGVSTPYEVMKEPNANVTLHDVCVAYPQFHYIVGCLLPPYLNNQFERSSQVYENFNWNICERIATYCGGVCSYVDSNSTTNTQYCNNTVIPQDYFRTTNETVTGTFRLVYREPVAFIFVFSFAKFIILKHVEWSGLFRIPRKNRRNKMPSPEMEKDLTYCQCTTFAGEEPFTVYRSLICSFVSHVKFLQNRQEERLKWSNKTFDSIEDFASAGIGSNLQFASPKMFRFIIYYDRICEGGTEGNETKKNIFALKTIHTLLFRLKEIVSNIEQNHDRFVVLCSLAEKLLHLREDNKDHYQKMIKSFTDKEFLLFDQLTNTVVENKEKKEKKRFLLNLDSVQINLLKYTTHVYNIRVMDNYIITTLNPGEDFKKNRTRGLIERFLDRVGTVDPPQSRNLLFDIYNFFFDRRTKSPGKYDGIETCRLFLLENTNSIGSSMIVSEEEENDRLGGLSQSFVRNSRKGFEEISAPNPGKNIFMGIIDARHAPRAEYWLVTLSQFFYVTKNHTIKRIDDLRSTQQTQQFEVERQTDEIGRECGHFFYITNYLRNLVKVVTSSGSQSVTHLGKDSSEKDFHFKFAVTEDLATSLFYILRGEKFGYTAYKDICFSSMKEEREFFISLMRWSAGSIECLFRTIFSRNFWKLIFAIFLVNFIPAFVTYFAYYSQFQSSTVLLYNLILIGLFVVFILLCQFHFFQGIFVLYACLTYPINSLMSSTFWMVFVVIYLSMGLVILSNPLVITILTILSLFVTIVLERIIIFLQQQNGHQVAGKGASPIFTAHAFKNWLTSPFLSYFILIAGFVNYIDRPKWNMNIFHLLFKWCIRLQCALYAFCIFLPFLFKFLQKLSPEDEIDQVELLQRAGNVNLAASGWIGAALAILYLTLCLPKLVKTTKATVIGGITLSIIIFLGTVCLALFIFPGISSWHFFTFNPTYIYSDAANTAEDYVPNQDAIADLIVLLSRLNITLPPPSPYY